MKGRPAHERVRFALQGLVAAWRTEASLRTEVMIVVPALGVLAWLGPSMVWWGLIGVAVSLVFAAELFNSAIENLADHLHPERHPRIGLLKDIAAGAVLVIALGAGLVGVLAALSVLRAPG